MINLPVFKGQCTSGTLNLGTDTIGLNPSGSFLVNDTASVLCSDSTYYVFRTDNHACLGLSTSTLFTCTGAETWSPYNDVYCAEGCPPISYDIAAVTVSPLPACGDSASAGSVTVSCKTSGFELYSDIMSLGTSPVNIVCQSPGSPDWAQNNFYCQGT